MIMSFVSFVSVASGQPPTFKSGIDLTTFAVTVTDKHGDLVAGLQPADFELYEDGRRQQITYFAAGQSGDQLELHLGLMLDVSDSMGEDLAFTKTAAIKFLNTLTDARDVTVVDFDTEVRVARSPRRNSPG